MNKKIGLFVFLLVSIALLSNVVGSQVPPVQIVPDPAYDNDVIDCQVIGGCFGIHDIYWYRNGNFYGGITTTLSYPIPASATFPGDVWRCDAFDYCSKNPLGTDSVTILAVPPPNTPPVITSIYVTPNPALINDVLTCVVTTFDADSDPVTLTYVWTTTGSYDLSAFQSNTLNLGVVSGEAPGDNITCTATPYDGTDYGTPMSNFTTIDILNFPPVISPNIPDVNLSQNSGFNNDVLDLWIYVTDATPDNLLLYEIVDETNPLIVNCLIDTNQYVDCDVQPNMVGFSDVRVRITDPGGLFAEDVFRVFVSPVNQLPIVNLVSPTLGQQFALCENITFLVNATDVDGSIQSIVWTIDGTTYTGNNFTLPATLFGAGTYSGSVVVTDNVGGTTTLSFNFIVLVHTDPTVMITQPINNPNPTTIYPYQVGTMITFDALATATDACTPPAGFNYFWTDTTGDIVTDDQTFMLDNLTLGIHNVTVYATDGIGGEAYDSIIINITPVPNACPVVNIISPVSTINYVNPCEVIDFTSSATDPDNDPLNVYWIYNSSIFRTVENFTETASYFGPATHQITVVADDGQCTSTASTPFTIVPHLNPNCLITSPINDPNPLTYYSFFENIMLTFSVTATAQDICVPGAFQYLWTDLYSPLDTDDQTFMVDNLTIGTHDITVYATDGFGGECYDTILVNITDTNIPPVANIITPIDNQAFVWECEMIDFTAQIFDPNVGGYINSISWIWKSNVLSNQENFTIAANTFDLGNNTVTLSVSDDEGVVTIDSVTFEVFAHTAPAVVINSPLNGTVYPEGTFVNFDAVANPTDVCPATYNWIWTDNTNPQLSLYQTFTLNNLSIGLHEITAYAYDQYGQSNYSLVFINITDVPNIAPIITGIRCVNETGGPRLKEWDPIYCNATAYDPDGVITSYIWSVNGSGVSIGPNISDDTFNMLAGLDDGNYTVTLTVLDNGTPIMSATDFINIEVFANMPPVVTINIPATDPYWNMEFCPINFSATASDPDGYIIQPWDEIFTWNIYMANGTSVFNYIDDPLFTYTEILPVGFNTFTVTVTDDDAATATDSVEINTTTNVPPTVEIMLPVSVPTYNISEGNNITFDADVTAGDFDDCSDCTLNDYTWQWFDSYGGIPAQISDQESFTLVYPGIGLHTITVITTDCYQASNMDTIFVNVTEVPNQMPIVTIWDPQVPPFNYIDHCEDVPFNASAVDPDLDDIVAWMWNYITVDGMQTMSVPVFSVPAMNFTIDNHTAYAYAFDNQTPPGIGSASVIFEVIEHINPIAAILDPVNGTNYALGGLINFTGSAAPQDRCNANTFSWIWTLDGTFLSSQQNFSINTLSLGWHDISLFATDQYGHSNSTTIYINITEVPNQVPIVTITSPVDPSVNYSIDHCEDILFNATAVDPDGDDISTWMWNYETIYGINSSTLQSFTLPASNFTIGNHTAFVYAFDNQTPPGVGSDSIMFEVVEHTDPNATINQPLNGTNHLVGVPVNFSGFATAQDRCNADTFSWVWTEDGNPMSFNSEFLYTFNLTQLGWHKINFIATDQYGHADIASVWINITQVINLPPVINSVTCLNMSNSTTIMEFEDFYCFGDVVDPDGYITIYSWQILGSGQPSETATDTYYPAFTLINGTYNTSLTVFDNGTIPLQDTMVVPLFIQNNVPQVTLTPPTQTGIEPYLANFTCSVLGGNMPYTYFINYSNGFTGILPNGNVTSTSFNVTYTQNGTYNVTCYVTDMDGDVGAASAIVIVTDSPLNAFFNWTPITPYENETVTFMDLSTTSVDPIVDWFWDFGDGTNSTLQNPTHVYVQEPVPLGTDGPYTVTLTITDSDGTTAVYSAPITVLDTAPTAAMAVVSSPAVEGTNVTFVGFGTGYDSPPLTYSWNFGDGNIGTGQVIDHIYTQSANYTVTLTVEDNDTTQTSVSEIVVITDTAPIANAGNNQTVDECTNVLFNSSLSTGYDVPLTYVWYFGDGTNSGSILSNTTTHPYNQQGTYIVTLNVTDNDGTSDSDTIYVTVLDTIPNAFFNHTPLSPAEGNSVQFDSAGSIENTCDSTQLPGFNYSWNFGDGTVVSGIGMTTPSHIYIDNGTYTVNLTIFDGDGSANSYPDTIEVGDVDPTASFTAMPNPANEAQTITFDPTASASGSATDLIVSYTWDFGDGSLPVITTLPVIQNYAYGDNGTYNVTLTVIDEDSSDAISQLITVTNVPPQNVDAYGMYYCTNGTQATVIATATDPAGINDPLTFQWDYNYTGGVFDVNISSVPTTSGMYIVNIPCPVNIGIYTLALNVLDDDGGVGNDTALLNSTTALVNSPPYFTPALVSQPWPVGVLFVYDVNATDPNGDLFTFSSPDVGITPAGLISTTFAIANNYTINVTVCDDSGFPNACNSGLFTLYVTAANVPPTASFTAIPNPVDEGTSVNFDGSGSSDSDGTISFYQWDFGDGNTGTGMTPTHPYADNGIYTVNLTVIDDDGAAASTTIDVTVNNVAPTPNAGGPYSGNEGTLIALSASATDPAGVNDLLTYAWDLDGIAGYETPGQNVNFNAVDDTGGPFIVGLQVSDDDGGVSTTTTTVTVNNVAPVANADGPYTCAQGTPIVLSGSATDAGVLDTFTYEWDYDNDGLYDDATGTAPSYPCTDTAGIHPLALRVTDDDSGIGIDSTTVNITVTAVNNPPLFNPALVNQSAVVGTPFVYDIDATDADAGDILNYTDDSPLFVIDPNTGVISFTPAAVGVSTVNVTVCDDSGFANACTSDTFVLTISVVALPACSDGIDNDGDTYIDMADSGCTGPLDNDETNPLFQCNDGVDNDGDTFIDMLDPDCVDLLDNTEGSGLSTVIDSIIDSIFYPGTWVIDLIANGITSAYIVNSNVTASTITNVTIDNSDVTSSTIDYILGFCPPGFDFVTLIQDSDVVNSVIRNTEVINSSVSNNPGLMCTQIIDSPATVIDSTTFASIIASDSTVIGSEINFSTVTNSNITDSVITFSTITDSAIIECTMDSSTLNGMEGFSCTITDSTVTDSTVNESTVQNGSIVTNSNITDNSIVDNSTVTDSTLTNSTVTNSTIENSTLVDVTVEDANITDDIIYYGNITLPNGTVVVIDPTDPIILPEIINYPPVADFTFSPASPTTSNTVSFTAINTDKNIGTSYADSWTYSWNFGDGTTSSVENPSNSFGSVTTYDVTLTITDNGGLSDSITKQISVASPPAPGGDTGDGGGGGGGGGSSGALSSVSHTCLDGDASTGKNDKVIVNYEGTNYTFFVQDVLANKIQLKLYPIPSRDYSVDEGKSKSIDLDRNFRNDFKIEVKGINGGKATVSCSILTEIGGSPEPEDDGDEEEGETTPVLQNVKEGILRIASEVVPRKKASPVVGSLIALAIVVAGLLIYYVTRKGEDDDEFDFE